jgi:hypothetical protein
MAQAYLVATGVICLARRKYITRPEPLVTRSNMCSFLIFETNDFVSSVTFLCLLAVSRVRSMAGLIPFSGARRNAVQTNKAAEVSKGRCLKIPTGSKRLSLIRWVQMALHAALIIRTVVGCV